MIRAILLLSFLICDSRQEAGEPAKPTRLIRLGAKEPKGLAVSPDGEWIALWSPLAVRVYRAKDLKQVFGVSAETTEFGFVGNGKYLCVVGKQALLYSTASWERVRAHDLPDHDFRKEIHFILDSNGVGVNSERGYLPDQAYVHSDGTVYYRCKKGLQLRWLNTLKAESQSVAIEFSHSLDGRDAAIGRLLGLNGAAVVVETSDKKEVSIVLHGKIYPLAGVKSSRYLGVFPQGLLIVSEEGVSVFSHRTYRNLKQLKKVAISASAANVEGSRLFLAKGRKVQILALPSMEAIPLYCEATSPIVELAHDSVTDTLYGLSAGSLVAWKFGD